MIIRDPIYGRFETPTFLDRLIMAPEVRRLSEIRLLNTPTPSLPTLSEIRRFSHTLGVLYLALNNPHLGLTKDEVRSLLAAILIHDAATPPLAHLLEYYLKDREGWNHELALPELLTGHHVFENVAHQILPGEELKFKRLCRSCSVDFDIVLEIVRKSHRASGLVFGSLDFDNLDNVARMAWALGIDADVAAFKRIAGAMAVSLEGGAVLSKAFQQDVKSWAAVRHEIYELLVFDELTVASQAVLTKAMRILFDDQSVSDINWSSRDRDFIAMLHRAPQTKALMLRHFSEALPTQVLSVRVAGNLADLGLNSRDSAIDMVEAIARDEIGIRKPFGYVFVDKGAFSKKLDFVDPATREIWSEGETSRSIVFYCFTPELGKTSTNLIEAFRRSLLANLGRLEVDAEKSSRQTRLTS